jgi:hypothetical protein
MKDIIIKTLMGFATIGIWFVVTMGIAGFIEPFEPCGNLGGNCFFVAMGYEIFLFWLLVISYLIGSCLYDDE